jgi:hypothetical protein
MGREGCKLLWAWGLFLFLLFVTQVGARWRAVRKGEGKRKKVTDGENPHGEMTLFWGEVMVRIFEPLSRFSLRFSCTFCGIERTS